MLNGSRYWANSCVVLKSGERYFVEDSEYSIKKKLESDEKIITLRTAGIYSAVIHIRKDAISSYRRYLLF